MAALPPDAVVHAAARWLRLLGTSTIGQAWTLLRSDSSYTDLTQTQYAEALEWLEVIGVLDGRSADCSLPKDLIDRPSDQLNEVVFSRAIELADPSWLADSDVLVPDTSQIPLDAASLAAGLGLTDRGALLAIRQVHGRLDLELRARIGRAGELALVSLLEAQWPGSTLHVALSDDGLGYDVILFLGGHEWHLEVKSTNKLGRLVIHLSRNEHEVALLDPSWRLVVVGLAADLSPGAVATVDHPVLGQRAPKDSHPGSLWESVRHQISQQDLKPGLPFLESAFMQAETSVAPLLASGLRLGTSFAWMPPPQ